MSVHQVHTLCKRGVTEIVEYTTSSLGTVYISRFFLPYFFVRDPCNVVSNSVHVDGEGADYRTEGCGLLR